MQHLAQEQAQLHPECQFQEMVKPSYRALSINQDFPLETGDAAFVQPPSLPYLETPRRFDVRKKNPCSLPMSKPHHDLVLLILLSVTCNTSAIRSSMIYTRRMIRQVSYHPAPSQQGRSEHQSDVTSSHVHPGLRTTKFLLCAAEHLRGGSSDRFFSGFDDMVEGKLSGINFLDMIYDMFSAAVILVVSKQTMIKSVLLIIFL